MIVGAFPPPGKQIFGGMVTSCRALLASTLPARVELDLLDSTQASNPPPALPSRIARAAVRFVRFVGRVEAHRPDAVLLFVADGASIVEKGAMAWYARIRGVPTVMLPRAGSIVDACRKSAFTRRSTRFLFGGARKIVCQSEVWREFAIQVLGFPPRDVAVIRNWTATRELLEIGARRTARRGQPVRLLFVGWLERDKGVFELIDACRQLVVGRSFTLDLAGEGHASPQARALVERHGLSDVVRFRGWLRAEHLHQALRDADVLVLPSWAEGLPNAMVEAMAARLALVVSRVGAIPEVITDRHSGLLVAPKDTQALRQALAEILDDGELRDRLAAEAYQIAECEFGVERAVDRLVQEIDNTIAAARVGVVAGDGCPGGRRTDDDAP
jgi:glycosyltransferase involved in cell wall biosynthesis